MRILYTAFKGKSNSSKLLLDHIVVNDKLYLTNSFKTSVIELERKLKTNCYDLIISFGQAPLGCDTLKIETTATKKSKLVTSYDYSALYSRLKKDYKVIISSDAGNYLCNHLYFYGLEFIEKYNLNTKMIFIHIPKNNKISDFEKLSRIVSMKGIDF